MFVYGAVIIPSITTPGTGRFTLNGLPFPLYEGGLSVNYIANYPESGLLLIFEGTAAHGGLLSGGIANIDSLKPNFNLYFSGTGIIR